MHTSDVRTPQGFSVLHQICSTTFPLILGVKVLHSYCCNGKTMATSVSITTLFILPNLDVPAPVQLHIIII